MENRTYYVSSQGNDAWSGTLSDPFATLERARDAVRDLGTERPGTTVIIRGHYERRSSFVLTAEDGGTPEHPVVWRGAPGEEVIMSGASLVSGPVPISDPEVLNRIEPDRRSSILSIDLAAAGITGISTVEQRGTPGLQLYIGGQRMALAVWPHGGWLTIADVPQLDGKPLLQGLEREKRFDGVPVGRHFGCIQYPGDRPSAWKNHADILLHGYWSWDWNDSYQTIDSIDTATRTIHLAEPHHKYGYTKNQRFRFLNILEEIDGPGKWCLERSTGTLYLWPPADWDGSAVGVTVLDDPLWNLTGASNITVCGITFEQSRGLGIRVTDSTNTLVAGCAFKQLGLHAVTISGTRNTVTSCDISDTSAGGIWVEGGDRPTLSPGHNVVRNNHIHHYSKWVRTYQFAIRMTGVGGTVAHNLIHDAPQEAIHFSGNEHTIKFNEIHSVALETGDVGAIHTGRDWTWRGTVVQHNYFHHLLGPGLHGVMGVYLDDWMSDVTIRGNVFYKAGRAAFIGGGRDNLVENNIFIACAPSVHMDARGTSWAAYYFDGTYPVLFEGMDAMRYDSPPYSQRYPELLELYDDEPQLPRHNTVRRNISLGGRWMDLHDRLTFADIALSSNYIADEHLVLQAREDSDENDTYFLNIDDHSGMIIRPAEDPVAREQLEQSGNIVRGGEDPFVDWRQEDFSIRPDSPAATIGFEPIPFDRIGLVVDEYRTVLPDRS